MTRRQWGRLAWWLLWLLVWLQVLLYSEEHVSGWAWSEVTRTLAALPKAAALATLSGLLFLGVSKLWYRWRPPDPPPPP